MITEKNLNKLYPSLERLARHFKVNRHSIYDRIKALEKKGYLVNEDGVYIPTIDGINQYMQDATLNRLKTGK